MTSSTLSNAPAVRHSYSPRSCFSLSLTTARKGESMFPRERARLEQWIVASLCRRRADAVFR